MTDVAVPQQPQAQLTLLGDVAKPIEGIYSREQIVDVAFRYWRERDFPYRELTLHECMHAINQLALTPDQSLLGTKAGYQVADTYHKHRFAASAQGMHAPLDSFRDDRRLRIAIENALEHGPGVGRGAVYDMLLLVRATQACANFAPGIATAIYRQFGKQGGKTLDTSSGYGGRLVGWIASGIGGQYVGIDPSIESCAANERMAHALGFADDVTQINSPAEDVTADELGRETFDLAFTSPPYFTKERYATGHDDESKQSWWRYPEPQAWRDGFLLPMLKLQYDVLKPGAVSVLNVADVRLNTKVHAVTEWTTEAAAAVGFDRLPLDMMLRFSRRFGVHLGNLPAVEPAYVFVKPGGTTQSEHVDDISDLQYEASIWTE